MAYSITAIDASVRAQSIAKKPFFLVDECLRYRTTVPQWRTSGSWATGSDITNASRPTRRIYDGQLGVASSPDDTIIGTSAPVYLLLDLVAAASRGFDAIMAAVDLSSVGSGAEMALQIADDNTYGAGTRLTLGQATSWETIGNRKIVIWDLTDGVIEGVDVSNVRFARLRFQLGTSPNWAGVPLVYEVALGRRFQFGHFPRYPHDPDQRASTFTDYVADSGWTQRIVRNTGMQPIQMSLMPQAGGLNGIDEVAAIKAWFKATNYGARNFLFCDNPGTVIAASGEVTPTDPPTGLWCLPPPAIAIPATGPSTFDFSTEFHELPPYRIYEADL